MTSPDLVRPAQPALDLHEEVAPRPSSADWLDAARERRRRILAAGCTRWPKALRLASTSGKLVPGRCGGTRLCDYCGILGGVEWSEMLALDAVEHGAPTVYVCLTTSRVGWDAREASIARQHFVRAVRDEWPGAEYACLVEFTTGYAATSGGKRRPHWNLLWKGVPTDDAARERMRELVSLYWCEPARAKLKAQEVKPVWAAGGLIRYLGLHFLKESQKPPRSWSGHRVTCSRGYFGAGRRGAREAAQESLRMKREIWKAERANGAAELARDIAAIEDAGADVPDALRETLAGLCREANTLAEVALIRAESVRWECVELTVDEDTGEIVRGRPIHGGDTVVAPQRSFSRPGHGTREEWALVDGREPVEVPAWDGERHSDTIEDVWASLARIERKHPLWGWWDPRFGETSCKRW